MKNNLINLAIVAVLFSITSCHKGDATSATIEIMEPMVNDTVAYNDSLHFEGTIVGNGTMYGYELSYTNAQTGEKYLDLPSEEKAKSYAFHEHWHNQVTDTTSVVVKVVATLDHKGTKTEKLVQVVCLPQ